MVILVGGLEAGIALHILNNLLAFAVAIVFGDLQGALTVSEVSWWQLPVTIAQNGVFLVLVLLVARRMGLSQDDDAPGSRALPSSPSAGTTRDPATGRRGDPAPIGGRRGVCVFSTVGPPRSTTGETVTGSHGVWGNWQPDWFWSS